MSTLKCYHIENDERCPDPSLRSEQPLHDITEYGFCELAHTHNPGVTKTASKRREKNPFMYLQACSVLYICIYSE